MAPLTRFAPLAFMLAGCSLAHADNPPTPVCKTVLAASGPALAAPVAAELSSQRSAGRGTSSVTALTMQAVLVCSW
jgi:hypothetical protein